jgi:hypothetical protein
LARSRGLSTARRRLALFLLCLASFMAVVDGAAGPEALVGGLRWGALVCVAFAVAAVPVVLVGLPGREREA